MEAGLPSECGSASGEASAGGSLGRLLASKAWGDAHWGLGCLIITEVEWLPMDSGKGGGGRRLNSGPGRDSGGPRRPPPLGTEPWQRASRQAGRQAVARWETGNPLGTLGDWQPPAPPWNQSLLGGHDGSSSGRLPPFSHQPPPPILHGAAHGGRRGRMRGAPPTHTVHW